LRYGNLEKIVAATCRFFFLLEVYFLSNKLLFQIKIDKVGYQITITNFKVNGDKLKSIGIYILRVAPLHLVLIENVV
jgi:hypothetical protein